MGTGSPRSTCRAPSPSDSACSDRKSSPSGPRAGGGGRGGAGVAAVAVAKAGAGRGALPPAPRKRATGAKRSSSSGCTISPSSISESRGGAVGGKGAPVVTTSRDSLPSPLEASASAPTTKTRRRGGPPSTRVESAWGGEPEPGGGGGGSGPGLSPLGKSWLKLLSS